MTNKYGFWATKAYQAGVSVEQYVAPADEDAAKAAGYHLVALQPAPAAEPVSAWPRGWKAKPDESGNITVTKNGLGGVVVGPINKSSIASEILHELALDLCAIASPTPQPDRTAALEAEVERRKETERFLRSERPMARRLTELEAEVERLRKALVVAQEFVGFCWRDVSLNDYAEDFRSRAEREIDAALAAKGVE